MPERTRIAIGQTYGRLTVLARLDAYVSPAGYTKTRWRCRCECGTEITTLGARLAAGGVTSCGCAFRDAHARRRKDLTGRRFGALTAVERLAPDEHRATRWRFRCDCGQLVDAQPSNLARTAGLVCRHG